LRQNKDLSIHYLSPNYAKSRSPQQLEEQKSIQRRHSSQVADENDLVSLSQSANMRNEKAESRLETQPTEQQSRKFITNKNELFQQIF